MIEQEQMERMQQAVEEIRRTMAEAAIRAGRKPEDILLCAACKTRTVEEVRASAELPIDIFGENHVQELVEKTDAGAYLGKPGHFIGHLQTNKAKQAVKLFDMIHSIDSIHLAEAVNSAAAGIDKVQDVLVQVNLAREESKTGVDIDELDELLYRVDELDNLRLRGLMLIAPNYEDVEDCRPLFRKMREIFEKVKEMPLKTANIEYLSMGMTHDYKIAIEEGANIVRVGTAIFGQRQY